MTASPDLFANMVRVLRGEPATPPRPTPGTVYRLRDGLGSACDGNERQRPDAASTHYTIHQRASSASKG